MSTPRFDLADIIRIIERRRRFIIIVTLLCLVVGLLFHFLKQKKYEAKVAFFVSNPIYADRSSMFAATDSRYTDYFGDEDDIDRVMALAESDTIVMKTMKNSGLDKAYNIDFNDPYAVNKLKLRYKKFVDIKRTEYKLLELSYTDKDPVLAANVANEAVKNIENGYREFYNTRKESAFSSISTKLHEIDSAVAALTDTLGALREESGIYDIISPSRLNLVISSVKGAGKGTGKYIELIQNIEAVKDALVVDRAKYTSLLGQYSTGVGPDEMVLLHVITRAKPPLDPAGPNIWIVLAASFFIGFFFSSIYVLLATYYREVVAVRD